MPETKKTETAKAVTAVKSAATEVKAPVAKAEVKKPAVKKATAAKKPAVKKAEPKKAEEKKVVAKKPAVKKATAAKEPATKAAAKTTELKANIVLQYADKNVTYDTLVENAQNVCVYDLGKKASDIKKLDLYVKPEEDTVYFVLNDEENGNYAL